MGGLGGFFPPLLLTAVNNITGQHAIAFMLLSEFALVSFVIVIFMYYQDKVNIERQIIEGAAEGILITNRKGIIVNVNPAFTRITGYAKEEAIGNTPKILRSGKHDDKFYDNMWNSIKKNGHWEGEIWNKRKNGELFHERLSISEVKNDRDEVIYYVGRFYDITKGK